MLNGDVIPLADVPWLYDFVRSPRDGNRNQNNLNILKIVMTVAAAPPARAPINCCFIFQIFISIFCEREREREKRWSQKGSSRQAPADLLPHFYAHTIICLHLFPLFRSTAFATSENIFSYPSVRVIMPTNEPLSRPCGHKIYWNDRHAHEAPVGPTFFS